MVPLAEIEEENAKFAAQQHADCIAVFLGATSGIGAGTLDALVAMLSRPKIYVVGRSASRFSAQRERLRTLNADATIVFLEAEISQLAEVERVSAQITAAESRVDYLCMSSGYLPIAGPVETKERLEQCFTLSYHARIRLLHNLLPQLRQSARPRVLSILGAGDEGRLRADDLGLERSWSLLGLVGHSTTMTTLVFGRLATQHPGVAFLHAAPGQVRTDIGAKQQSPGWAGGGGVRGLLTFYAMRILMAVVALAAGSSPADSGRRHAFLLTSDRFGPGLCRIRADCELAPPSKLLDEYRRDGTADQVWEFTTAVWSRVLGRTS